VTSENAIGFSCYCLPLWHGTYCDTPITSGFCENAPCLNGGSCTETQSNFVCTCPPLFTGTSCELDVLPCVSNPCFNSGLCQREDDGGYSCFCLPQYTGSQCESLADPCVTTANVCNSQGICNEANTTLGYLCYCLPQYAGPNCDIRKNELEKNENHF
jgi:hypothetical protein